MDNRKLIIIISGLAIVLFAFFSMKWLGERNKAKPKKPIKEVVRYVKTERVEYKNIVTEIEATGRVISNAEVPIIAQVRGEIKRGDIVFKIGESFRKGDLIVKIDDTIELYNMKSRKSSFLNGVAQMLPALKVSLPNEFDEWTLFMEKIDVDKDLPPLPEISTTQERVYMASRNILTNYYTIKSAEANFKFYHIYAPFSGTITEVNLQAGAVANPGSRLGKIINTSNLELEVPIKIKDSKWIRMGAHIKVYNAEKTSTWSGRVIRKSKNVNPTTQSINVYISLNRSNKNPIYKGEYFTANFGGIKLSNVMEISRKAVFNQNEVFVVEDSLLAKREIKIRRSGNSKVYFTGLETGANIVVEPLINATENTKVRIIKK